MPSPGYASTARALLRMAELLPEACRLLEDDPRPEAREWLRRAQGTAIGVISRRTTTEE